MFVCGFVQGYSKQGLRGEFRRDITTVCISCFEGQTKGEHLNDSWGVPEEVIKVTGT